MTDVDMTTAVPDPRRWLALAILLLGAAIGLVLGGLLTQYADWRWCLFVNIIIAAARPALGYLHGYNVAFMVSAFLLAVSTLFIFALIRGDQFTDNVTGTETSRLVHVG